MGKHTLTRHHRCPQSHRIFDPKDPENISMVQDQHHRAFHLLFRNMGVDQIVWELNHKWIDPRYTIVAIPTVLK